MTHRRRGVVLLLLAMSVGCLSWPSPLAAQEPPATPIAEAPAPAQERGGWAPVQDTPKAEAAAEASQPSETSGGISSAPAEGPTVGAPQTDGTTFTNDAVSAASDHREGTEAAPAGTETATPPHSESNPHALPGELSPWGMFLAADIVVKAVMIGLAAASFLVWTIWIAKRVQLALGRRRFAADLSLITAQPDLTNALASVGRRKSLASAMLDVALREKQASGGRLGPTSLGRIHSRLSEIESGVSRDVRSGMSFLATVAATGPFIGLFGTVWGIMNSFIGISKSQTTNLAVVAPGIAEALLATAIGLVAAIPAVILYNNLGKGVSGYKRLARETRGEVERIASRELDDASEFRRYSRLAPAAE